MRIRKRPPPQTPSDPSPQPQPSNATLGGGGLHPQGDGLLKGLHGWRRGRGDPNSTQISHDPSPIDSHQMIGVLSLRASHQDQAWQEGNEIMEVDPHMTWINPSDKMSRKPGASATTAIAASQDYTGSEEMKVERDDVADEKGSTASGKKRRSPAVLKEGSRCSRVNGRGWRCCQQTLVGYSLCEHHLGKARLRSMSGLRPGGSGNEKQDMVNCRRKLGVFKARSISSLINSSEEAKPTVPDFDLNSS